MKILPLKNTEEALTFGKIATPEQKESLLEMRCRYLTISNNAMVSGDCQKALDAACKAQFCREARQAGEIKND